MKQPELLKVSTRQMGVGFVVLALLTMATASCAPSLMKPKEVNSRDEAGAVLLSVNSVAPWDQVADAMQPNFTLKSGDAALAQVIPATAKIQEQVLSAFGLSLGLGLPQSFSESLAKKVTEVKETTQTTGKTSTTSSTSTTTDSTEETDTEKPGAAPTPATGTPAGGEFPAGEVPAGDLGLDPLLKYQAAKSLYQAVQLMNREIQFAAVRQGYVPFMVRMQLAALPYQRNLPYDIHAKVSFFPTDSSDYTEETPLRLNEQAAEEVEQTATQVEQTATEDDAVLELPGPELPYVVPLLVTDNLEQAIKSRAVEVARQIGLAVSAMIQGVGAELGLDAAKRDRSSLLGADLNSLLTVARLTDNSVYVRLGAANQATAGNALISRTYDITLLLLVPQWYFDESEVSPGLSVITHTELRHAFSGEVLQERSNKALLDQVDLVFERVIRSEPGMLEAWQNMTADEKLRVATILLGPIHSSELQEFYRRASEIKIGTKSLITLKKGFLRSLWVGLSGLTAESAFKSASVQIPRPSQITIPSQTALMRDDTKKNLTIVLKDTKGVTPRTVSALLTLRQGDQSYEFPADQIQSNESSGTTTLVFPSPAIWGIKKLDLANSHLTIQERECPYENACPKVDIPASPLSVLHAKIPSAKPTPGFQLRVSVSHIVEKGGVGSIKAHFDKFTDEQVVITVSEANMTSAKDGSGNDLKIAQDKIVTGPIKTLDLQLDSLRVGTKVVLKATGMKGGKGTGELTKEFSVVEGDK